MMGWLALVFFIIACEVHYNWNHKPKRLNRAFEYLRWRDGISE
jgi:hypothetical protein